MKTIKKLFLLLIMVLLTTSTTFADEVWINDLRTLFVNNSAIIYEINLRTFNAQDTNTDGIIDLNEGEESGTFLNAIGRLDELKLKGINTIHVLPITSIGKTKALGTAGSLYSALSFNKLNPQLKSEKSALSVDAQARKFIDEAHKRHIRVIIDLPSCGSYDLFLQRPELFVKDKTGQPVVPADWTDVRLLNAGSENSINMDVFNVYKEFVDIMIDLGADGIRADVATCKPAKFWSELINYSRKKDPQFLWLAEASDSWNDPVSEYAVFTPYNKLLEAGFDGFYGSYFNLKNWKTAKELISQVELTKSLASKYTEPKAVIGSFTTHDELSPMLINGYTFSDMIIWLNATLPVNSYFVDGFDTGDSYIYFWANKKALKTYTDDDYYFVHRGKIDIFNFSRQPGAKNMKLASEFALANNFKTYMAPVLTNGKFLPLKTSDPSVFAYSISYNGKSVVVMGNLNFRNITETIVYIPKFEEKYQAIPIKITGVPVASRGKYTVKLYPGEIQVILINDFEIK